MYNTVRIQSVLPGEVLSDPGATVLPGEVLSDPGAPPEPAPLLSVTVLQNHEELDKVNSCGSNASTDAPSPEKVVLPRPNVPVVEKRQMSRRLSSSLETYTDEKIHSGSAVFVSDRPITVAIRKAPMQVFCVVFGFGLIALGFLQMRNPPEKRLLHIVSLHLVWAASRSLSGLLVFAAGVLARVNKALTKAPVRLIGLALAYSCASYTIISLWHFAINDATIGVYFAGFAISSGLVSSAFLYKQRWIRVTMAVTGWILLFCGIWGTVLPRIGFEHARSFILTAGPVIIWSTWTYIRRYLSLRQAQKSIVKDRGHYDAAWDTYTQGSERELEALVSTAKFSNPTEVL